MATEKQKKVAKELAKNVKRKKPVSAGKMLENVGYSKHLVKQPKRVIDSNGVKEELKVLGFTLEAADKVVKSIMDNEDLDPNPRLKASDQMYKRLGGYAPTKTEHSGKINTMSDEDIDKRLEELIARGKKGS